ncbi:putative hydrolase (metallo-beta-lactamase superfamily) [Caldisphaera lagunensis DSM 15908]|uniref:UPF0282 protein Calag_0034 n=1 Tax=Caldisphaera lagunensis (strain DSM 15908 / JCM 11604 / ANMR 0165 / IC-154) TaxID=1056495 RepID=L0A9L1_CALLD|nr:hydrolase [Caldisphaera lagunensis]AFZ69827.1 putative hydrolase (metallo-beta-lactamase superfamily) [Caldisphaera lagunensis DSM 15908]
MKFIKIGKFNVSILGSDSFGVRSLATFVNVCNKNIGIDLGASLAPRRYGLPPHKIELERLSKVLLEIENAINISDYIIITHYHYDHYIKDKPNLYYGKTLFIKDPKKNVNRSQSYRAKVFLIDNEVQNKANVNIADNNKFDFGDLKLEFSNALWHGEDKTKVGKLVMARIICNDQSIIFGSDTQGPGNQEALEKLIEWKGAELLIISGPPTYFAGYKVSQESVEKGLENMKSLIEKHVSKIIIADHHLLRDIHYKDILKDHYKLANDNGVSLITAAEFMGYPIDQLEARRKELWGK